MPKVQQLPQSMCIVSEAARPRFINQREFITTQIIFVSSRGRLAISESHTWDFVAPVATLYAEPSYHGEVGTHYVGPHWESKSGSKVKAARVQDTGCTPDPSAIAWLLLKKTETSGNGIFTKVTTDQHDRRSGAR